MNSSDQKLNNTTLALAGIFQTAALVREIATKGITDENAFHVSINSIYKVDAKDVPDVYGGTANLHLGLNELIRLFGEDKTSTDTILGRYVISILHLERKLAKNQEMLHTLTRRIKYAVSQANYFSDIHPTVIASLADIYLNTLGTLPFRIQVMGQAKFLNQPEIVNKVRALLLAGIRSAVLWHQKGGRRWQLFFWRSRIKDAAKQLLKN